MTGEKLKPLVIAKSSNPRCLKNIKVEKLPVHFRDNKKARMTTELMSNWLRIVDKDMRKAGWKILLFLDNAPSHPMLKLSNVKLAFFPPNTTSRLQPMDQGIIQTPKLKYRKKQLQHILVKVDSSNKVGSQLLKEISVLDAIYWIDAAWRDIKAKTIVKCFPSEPVESVNADGNDDSDDDEVPLNVLKLSHDLFGCEFKDLINLEVTLRTCDDSYKTG
ncbi:tigger transposable element-derived protein 6-like [Ruditapes philippinarum]|uniref:tigger transposable element-derived protein 6-like n=1 Tax=Ruditapes philippinarum TaxID=129788 RepID=UPI00295BFD3F|nr:tigger transposable element-derived protein 6-like [Ruditapes philippinarum]